ncbi:heterokaryon incompatibility protein-domain-containing protein [Sordaria brevicollis]|uniref:Heterokaryon incompatibility protein-domain-containing protein n=1 Tax=Sordaria brevicollis TaxID=83679 RepID=A0AAE0UDA5_SORBR|nr:heterokaryon incompatibility protein-domain-containing protein [Sordaria brevicollis]
MSILKGPPPGGALRPPLDPAADEIRLLDIFPSENTSSPVACRYRIISLIPDQGQYVPCYEALSYAWKDAGNDPETEASCIIIDGNLFPVSSSLLRALRRLRYTDRIRTLWVDAVCINQFDDVEKTQQVNLMRRIYASCTQCNIWLGYPRDVGVSEEHAQAAFDTISWITAAGGAMDARFNGADVPNPSPPGWFQDVEDDGIDKVEGANHELRLRVSEAFYKLFRTPWWSRVWTVQEAALPSAATVYWGDCEISWHTLDMASEAIMAPDDGRREEHVGYLMPEELYKFKALDYLTSVMRGIKISSGGSEDPVSTLYRWRGRKSTDPRDKVYGLMGLKGRTVSEDDEEDGKGSDSGEGVEDKDHVDDNDDQEEAREGKVAAFLSGIPSCDYTLDAQTLFCRVSWALIKQSNSLQPLIGRRGEPAKLEGLPSWVIDWSQDRWSDGFFYFNTEEKKVPVQVPAGEYWEHEKLFYHYCADGPVMVGPGPRLLDEAGRVLGLDGFLVDRIAVVEQREVLGRAEFSGNEVLLANGARYGELIGRCHGYFSSASEESRTRWQSGSWMQEYLGVMTGQLDPAMPGNCPCDRDEWASTYLQHHLLFVTEGGKVGFGPVTSEPGDEVWILELCRLPVVLKPLHDSSPVDRTTRRAFTWVGDCCVYGIMMGEAVAGKEDAWIEVAVH